MRWNGDSTLFAAVRYYRCIPQRITRGSNGLRTVIRRPPVCLLNAGVCPASLKRLAERQEEAAPPHLHAARQCVRACATSDAGTNLRPGSRLRPRLGVASQTLPDGRTAPARIPAATCAGWHYAAHARPTSDAEQSLHTGRASRHRNKNQNKTNKHSPGPGPGLKSESRRRLSGPKNGRLPAGGAEFGAAARG